MSSPAPATRVLRFGDIELDPESGELRKNGVTTRLQEQPFRILLELLQRPGEVVTRTELRDRLWTADTFVDFETSLNSAVKKLRDALGDSAENPQYIETFKRRGYRFIVPAAVASADVEPIPAVSRSGATPFRLWLAVALLTLIAAATWFLSRRDTPSATAAAIDSIAVLPLDNLSGDKEQDYFADSMTDALITNLAQIGGLRVISRTSIIQYKGARKSLPEIARELDVEAIVEGTVVRSGSRVRVTAQLIHASSDRHLWAKSYERELVDVFSLQGELAQAIADAIEVNVTPQVRAGLGRAWHFDREAVDAFFLGTEAMKRAQAEDITKSIEHFERAVAIEPEFAVAHAAIGRAHYQFAFVGKDGPLVFMPDVERALRRALQIDPRLAEARAMLANVLYRFHLDWKAAETEFRRALEFSPSDGFVHTNYSRFLSARGRFDEAAVHREIARKLDPNIAATYLDEPRRTPEEFERAVAAFRIDARKNPRVTRVHFQLGSALVMAGQYAEGVKELEASDPWRHGRYLGYLGYGYAKSGDVKKAREVLEELRLRSRKQYISSFAIALVHIGLGEKEAAIDRLEVAYREKAFELSHVNATPAFDSLRTEARYRELLKKIGLA